MEIEPQISHELMGIAMEHRFHVIDAVRAVRPKVVIPQLRAGAGHHRAFSIVPGGTRTVTVHTPSTRKRSYEFFVISTMDLHQALDPKQQARAAAELGGIAPSTRHVEGATRFTGDTDADPFRGQFSLGALYDVATAVRRGGHIPEEVSMEFETAWKGENLRRIIIHLEYPENTPAEHHDENLGPRLDSIAPRDANEMAAACVDKVRSIAEQKFRISPATLDSYVMLDETGTRVFGIGVRRWLD